MARSFSTAPTRAPCSSTGSPRRASPISSRGGHLRCPSCTPMGSFRPALRRSPHARTPTDVVVLISLIGMPGGGKSTVGRQLARRLGVDFIDTDAVIEQRAGISIPELFARDGEPAFRAIETDVLQTVARERQGVLATGGGIVLAPANRE